MPQASIDQFAVAYGLEKAGFNARQAEAMVRAMNIISGSSEQIASDVAQLKQDVSQLKHDVKNLVTKEEFQRELRRQAVRLYAAVGAGYAFTVGTVFAMLQFMLP